MADKQNKWNPEPSKDNLPIEPGMLIRGIEHTEGDLLKRGREIGPPQARTGGNAAKTWQPPQKESTPNNRVRKT